MSSGSTGTSEPVSFTFVDSTDFEFTLPLLAVVLAAEIAVAPLAVFQVQSAPVLRGMIYGHDQGRSVSPAPIGAPNKRVRSLDAHEEGSSEHDIGRRSIHGR
jgi:hypothetical protein